MTVGIFPTTKDHLNKFQSDTIFAASNMLATKSNNPQKAIAPFIRGKKNITLPPPNIWIEKGSIGSAKNITELFEKNKTTSFLVMRNDTILYEDYFNGSNECEQRINFSVSKSFTAVLTAIAEEEGLIRMDQKVYEFIPAFKKKGRDKITIGDLLDMRSGIDMVDAGDLIRLGLMYYVSDQERFIKRYTRVKYQPGAAFAYKSIDTQILGICLEKALGKSIAAYLQEKICAPIGMEHDAYITLDSRKHHNTRTFGGYAFTTRDLARFGRLLLNNGVWEGKRIIPASFIKKLRERPTDGTFWTYVNSFWRNGYEDRNFKTNLAFYAAGLYGQYVYVDPERNMVFIRTGDNDDIYWTHAIGRLAEFYGEGGNDLTDVKKDFSSQFSGVYTNEEGDVMAFIPVTKTDVALNRQQWRWERSSAKFKVHRSISYLNKWDGISIGFKEHGRQVRVYFDVNKAGRVVGMYYNAFPMRTLIYFKKQ
jgi:CubicO group peptidase (beta-lactamase class C family)